MHRGPRPIATSRPRLRQMEGNPSVFARQRCGVDRRHPALRKARIPRPVEIGKAAARSTERVVPAGTDSVVISNSAVGIVGAGDTFQSRLRERRKEAVTGCGTCTVGPASAKGSESVDTLKKAI